MRIFLYFAVAFAMLGTARATTLTYSGFSVLNAQTVTLSGSAVAQPENASAGQVKLLGINGGTGVLSTFCIDVADWLTPKGQFSTGNYLTGSFADQLNALVSHVLPTLAANTLASAALQVAIWETEYGSNLTVSGNRDVTDLASQYLGSVRSGLWTADRTLAVAVLDGGGTNQTQAYLAKVPEPATFALLGFMTLGVIAWRTRRSRSAFPYSRLATTSINCRPPEPNDRP